MTPLCERCGYAIEGLPASGDCPECGARVADSLPAHRVGSAWQQRASVATWWLTLGQLLRRPRSFFARIRVDGSRCRSLLTVNLIVSGLFMAVAPTVFIWRQYAANGTTYGLADESLTVALALAIFWFTSFWVLWLLTMIERLGLQVIGRQRGWRVTGKVAASVCAHASYGWIASGVLAIAGGALGAVMNVWWAEAMSLVGLGLGLLVFETVVYVGVRACRFANVDV